MKEDKGHKKLIKDIKFLLKEAEKFEFHDFKNTTYAAPKVTLHMILTNMALKVTKGEYDN